MTELKPDMQSELREKMECIYCHKKPDGAMLTMGTAIAHAPCVIRKLNELVDPDYKGKGEPKTSYVKLAKYQKFKPIFQRGYEKDRELAKVVRGQDYEDCFRRVIL